MGSLLGSLINEAYSIKSIASLSARQVSQVRAISYVNNVIIHLDMAELICLPSCNMASLERVG
jgi:hypothetical protein